VQVTELWERFDGLNEIWFDGGYTSDMQVQLKALLRAKQPNAVGFNGGGISPNPARWSGTEGDVPPGGPDIWSTACGDTDWGAGAPPESCPATSLFYPSGTDYTLQSGDVWFWEPGPTDGGRQTLRSLQELISTYHATVGHNTVLELDFAIDRHGLVEQTHVERYQQFGDWIRQCYHGEPLAEGRVVGGTSVVTIPLTGSGVFDRIMLQEDQQTGQHVRGWTVEWAGGGELTWSLFASGKSVGNKRIALSPTGMNITATHARLNITASVGQANVTLKLFSACPAE
jgi:alpha-L-fucosidase